MALDPEDILKPPYRLGECEESSLPCVATCSSWEIRQHDFLVHLRNRGNITEVIIPELLFKSKKDQTHDIIQFTLPSMFYNKVNFLGSYPESLRIAALGMNGCNVNTDLLTNEICECTIDMDFEGNFYIAPTDDDEGFSCSTDGDQIGTFSFSFTFSPNHTPPEEGEAEPEAKTLKLDS